jgi:hypothetical protein
LIFQKSNKKKNTNPIFLTKQAREREREREREAEETQEPRNERVRVDEEEYPNKEKLQEE